MDAKDVKPKDWLMDKDYPIRVLYDNGEYSVIWGKYRDTICLGTRWNYSGLDSEKPSWYIEPDFLASSILQRLLTMALDSENYGYLENINFAINELNTKLVTIDV